MRDGPLPRGGCRCLAEQPAPSAWKRRGTSRHEGRSPNGGLNFSVLDGWWGRGVRPRARLGDRRPHRRRRRGPPGLARLARLLPSPGDPDRADVLPPGGWRRAPRLESGLVKRSIKAHAPRFSTARMVAEYTERFYMPAKRDVPRPRRRAISDKAREALAWRGPGDEGLARRARRRRLGRRGPDQPARPDDPRRGEGEPRNPRSGRRPGRGARRQGGREPRAPRDAGGAARPGGS